MALMKRFKTADGETQVNGVAIDINRKRALRKVSNEFRFDQGNSRNLVFNSRTCPVNSNH